MLEFAEGDVDDDPASDTGTRNDTDSYGWIYTGDRAYLSRAGSCTCAVYSGYGNSAENSMLEAEAQSWSGRYALGYERYRDAHLVPTPASPRGTVTIRNDKETEPQLALWAQSRCEGVKSYHRITVTPELEFGAHGEEKELTLTRGERKKISADARATLDRYLAAEDAWPSVPTALEGRQ